MRNSEKKEGMESIGEVEGGERGKNDCRSGGRKKR